MIGISPQALHQVRKGQAKLSPESAAIFDGAVWLAWPRSFRSRELTQRPPRMPCGAYPEHGALPLGASPQPPKLTRASRALRKRAQTRAAP